MKLAKLLLVFIITFILALITSMLLDVPWFMAHFIRKLIVLIVIVLQLFAGFLVFKEILNQGQ